MKKLAVALAMIFGFGNCVEAAPRCYYQNFTAYGSKFYIQFIADDASKSVVTLFYGEKDGKELSLRGPESGNDNVYNPFSPSTGGWSSSGIKFKVTIGNKWTEGEDGGTEYTLYAARGSMRISSSRDPRSTPNQFSETSESFKVCNS